MGYAGRALSLAVALVGPAAAHAQAAPSTARCREFLARVPFVALETPATRVTATAPATCRYDGVLALSGARFGYRADTLTVAGIGFDPAASRGPPMTLRVEARGVGPVVHSGNANLDWMLAQQRGAGFAVTLDLTYDPTARVATLRELSLDGERVGRVAVDGQIVDVGPVDGIDHAPPGIEQIAIGRLHLRMDSRSFVTAYLLPTFVGTLPASGSVAETQARVDRQLAGARAGVAILLKASGAAASAAAAVDGFIADLPHPQHPFELTAVAADPLRLGEVAPALDSADALTALARRVAIEATYEGAFRP